MSQREPPRVCMLDAGQASHSTRGFLSEETGITCSRLFRSSFHPYSPFPPLEILFPLYSIPTHQPCIPSPGPTYLKVETARTTDTMTAPEKLTSRRHRRQSHCQPSSSPSSSKSLSPTSSPSSPSQSNLSSSSSPSLYKDLSLSLLKLFSLLFFSSAQLSLSL